MIIWCPEVTVLNRLKSLGKCHNKSLFLPNALFWATAAINVIIGIAKKWVNIEIAIYNANNFVIGIIIKVADLL